MRFGLDVAQHQLTWEALLARVRWAEEVGFEGVWLFDHFKALYGDPLGPSFEAWTLMAALAATTDRIRLGTMVTGVTYRHPSILATEAVTIDHISNGRLNIAIGASWFEQEHRELGIPFPDFKERAERLEEAVHVLRALMTADEVSYAGKYYQLQNATYRPRPVQLPTPPIWVGAKGERIAIPIAARVADVWHTTFSTIPDLIRKSEILDRAAREAGRDPASIARATSLSIEDSWDTVRQRVRDLQEIGFFSVMVGWPSGGQERVDEFAQKIMPEFADAAA